MASASSRKCFGSSGPFLIAAFPSRRRSCWLAFAADFIASFSTCHSWCANVRRHSGSASSTLLGSDSLTQAGLSGFSPAVPRAHASAHASDRLSMQTRPSSRSREPKQSVLWRMPPAKLASRLFRQTIARGFQVAPRPFRRVKTANLREWPHFQAVACEVPAEPCALPAELHAVPKEPSAVPEEVRAVLAEPRAVPEEPHAVPEEPCAVPEESRKVPEEPCVVPAEARALPEESRALPPVLPELLTQHLACVPMARFI